MANTICISLRVVVTVARPLLGTARKRDVFLKILDGVRDTLPVLLVGYVVMPEHIPPADLGAEGGKSLKGDASLEAACSAIAARKGRSRNVNQMRLWGAGPGALPRSFWQRRFYDFNVWSEKKRVEKLNYMHMNPVKRGLVADAKMWAWSSYRFYQYGEKNLCTPDLEPK